MNASAVMTVQEVLDKIDDVLSKGTPASQALWDVLVALRGPDDKNTELKRTTTCIIRTAAFPKTRRRLCESFDDRIYRNGAEFAHSATKVDLASVRDRSSWGHFNAHVSAAASVLLNIVYGEQEK